MRILLTLLALLFNIASMADDNTLNVYNWSNYMPDSVLAEFTRETGIKVNYSTYDNNETLYAKLKANPNIGYDVVTPSTYFVHRMIRQGMLQKLDKKELSNLHNLNLALLNKSYDPDNQYSIPYFWSSTGIAVNTRYHSLGTVKTWDDLWSSRYLNQLLLLNDVREVFSIALIALGYSPNSTNPAHIKQAYLKLRQLMPNVKIFTVDGVRTLYLDEDLTLGMSWNGDAYRVQQENPSVRFVYPKEGYIVAIDSMVIPIGARHVDNAHKFINFILRPNIAAKMSIETGYASPNLAARQYLPKILLANSILYPDTTILQRSIIQDDVGEAIAIYEKYWELLKIGG